MNAFMPGWVLGVHEDMDLGTFMRPNEVTKYSWGALWVPLWGVSMSDLSLGFHKKAVTLAHSAHGSC
ncbi:MAG: hypothetical protein V3R68_03075 [Gammaproteobacteria bacterium]